MSMSIFTPRKTQEDNLPSYPAAVYRIPTAISIKRVDGREVIGDLTNQLIFVQLPNKNILEHLNYLSDSKPRGKGYEFLGFCGLTDKEKKFAGHYFEGKEYKAEKPAKKQEAAAA